MCYCGPMGYGTQIPAHQIGGQIGLWGIRGYGLSDVCDKRGSTVFVLTYTNPLKNLNCSRVCVRAPLNRVRTHRSAVVCGVCESYRIT